MTDLKQITDKLTELADKIQIRTEMQDVKDYSRVLIDLSNSLGDAETEAVHLKLVYYRLYKARFAELIDDLKAVSKTEQAVEIELLDEKEAYKMQEAVAGAMKTLYSAHVNNLRIAKLDLGSSKTADVSVNSFQDENESDLPF